MIKTVNIRQFSIHAVNDDDLALIKKIAGKDIEPEKLFLFPKFIIARSGVNYNKRDITAEGQKQAIDGWINKAILFESHLEKSSNQIGRIYKTQIEDINGETITYGWGYGIKTDDLIPIFDRIDARVHKEMSCSYDPQKSLCSKCDNEMDQQTDTCSNGHTVGYEDVYAKDISFLPHNISFVSAPAVIDAGLVAASRKQETQLNDEQKTLIEDGNIYREICHARFITSYKMNKPESSIDDVADIANRLTCQQMLDLSEIQEKKFKATIPDGRQICEMSKEQTDIEEIRSDEETLKAFRKKENK